MENQTVKMEKWRTVREFTRNEEIAHAATHGAGALLGVLGLILLITKASAVSSIALASVLIFGISIILLYAASSNYHVTCAIWGDYKPSRLRDLCMKIDHSTIYLLILGTYAPVCLAGIGGVVGTIVFLIVLITSVVGFMLNMIDVTKFAKVSLALYLIAGWTIAAVIYPCFKAMGWSGILLLTVGGVVYTAGVVFFRMKKVKYMHVVWHTCVISGTLLHYLMIYLCVL